MEKKYYEMKNIYKKIINYFKNTEKYNIALWQFGLSLKKIGSDILFKLCVCDNEKIELVISTNSIDGLLRISFSENVVGILYFQKNGKCINEGDLKLTNKRQQLELQEMIEHVKRSLRPNSINFIMDD